MIWVGSEIKEHLYNSVMRSTVKKQKRKKKSNKRNYVSFGRPTPTNFLTFYSRIRQFGIKVHFLFMLSVDCSR